MVVTSVAQAGCSGPPLTHNCQCSCNPGLHWDPVVVHCQPDLDNPEFYPGPPMPFVPPPPQPGYWG
jgi:hypothetical protein